MKFKSLLNNILKAILIYAALVIVIGSLEFVLGELSYGNEVIATIFRVMGPVLGMALIFILSGLFVALYFWREHKLRNKVSWKRVLLIIILSIIASFGLYSFGHFFIIATFVLIICIVAWKYIKRSLKTKQYVNK